MGIYHVLEGTPSGNRIYHRVILHIPVPPAQQLPAVADAMAGFLSVVPDIAALELQGIQAGQVIEWEVDGFHSRDAADITGMINRIRDDYLTVHRPAAVQVYKDTYQFYLEQSDTLPE